jgi:hypothetical protein
VGVRPPITIDTPCGADFASMTPVAQRQRLCRACDKQVHDLSGRSDDEVRALLTAGPVCIRYLYDANGRIVHQLPRNATLVPARALLSRSDRQRWMQAAAIATSALVFEACGGNDGARRFTDPSTIPASYTEGADAATDAGTGDTGDADDAAASQVPTVDMAR